MEYNAMRLSALKLTLVYKTMMCVLYNSDVYISDIPCIIYSLYKCIHLKIYMYNTANINCSTPEGYY